MGLHCISVKTTCFVLAIINAIVNGLTLVCFSIVGIAGLIELTRRASYRGGYYGDEIRICGNRDKRSITEGHQPTFLDLMNDYWIPFPYLLLISGVFSLITFIFSVILCYGINNRRWRLVRSYFIYGCVTTVLALVSTTVQASIGHMWELVVLGLVGCALYSLFLVLVHKTYNELLEEAKISDRENLVKNMESSLANNIDFKHVI